MTNHWVALLFSGAILRIQNAQIRMIASHMRLEVQSDFFPNLVAWVWRRKRLEMVVLVLVDSLVLVYSILRNPLFDINFARIFIILQCSPEKHGRFSII